MLTQNRLCSCEIVVKFNPQVISVPCDQACGAGNAPLLQATDDGSGKQRWSIVPVPGAVGQYYIVGQGRPFGGCGSFLGAPNCASGNYPLVLTTGDDGEGPKTLMDEPEGGGGGGLWHADSQAGPHSFICLYKLAYPGLVSHVVVP